MTEQILNELKIAAAQTIPQDSNVSANIADHIRLTELAAANGAQLILFPEMSLTGYLMEQAMEHAFTENDARLTQLRKLSSDKNITIIAGAPIQIEGCLYIGSFVMQPDNTIAIYTKQFLHEGEERFFSNSFDYNPTIRTGSENISVAICADIENPLHPRNAADTGCSLYAAGIFYTPDVPAKAHAKLSDYAKQYAMNVLMANYGGPSWGQEAGGSSAFWTKDGTLIGALADRGEGLLIAARENNNWTTGLLYTS